MIKVMYKDHELDTVQTLTQAMQLYTDIAPDEYYDMEFIVGKAEPVGAFDIAFAGILESAMFHGYNAAFRFMYTFQIDLKGHTINPQDEESYNLLCVMEALEYPTQVTFSIAEGLTGL